MEQYLLQGLLIMVLKNSHMTMHFVQIHFDLQTQLREETSDNVFYRYLTAMDILRATVILNDLESKFKTEHLFE